MAVAFRSRRFLFFPNLPNTFVLPSRLKGEEKNSLDRLLEQILPFVLEPWCMRLFRHLPNVLEDNVGLGCLRTC